MPGKLSPTGQARKEREYRHATTRCNFVREPRSAVTAYQAKSVFGTKKVETMKFYVTYCITHPTSTPTTSTGLVEAATRLNLEARLSRGVGKWKKLGYTVEIVKVSCIDDAQHNK